MSRLNKYPLCKIILDQASYETNGKRKIIKGKIKSLRDQVIDSIDRFFSYQSFYNF